MENVRGCKAKLRAAALALRASAAAETASAVPVSALAVIGCGRRPRLRNVDDVFADADVIAGYLALPGEADPLPLMKMCADAGKEVVVPAWSRMTRRYSFCRWTPGIKLAAGPMRVPEPEYKTWMPSSRVDLVIVPGLVFGKDGTRIGFGGGHYDRLLSRCSAAAVKAGFAFRNQISGAKLPSEPHDITMDLLIIR